MRVSGLSTAVAIAAECGLTVDQTYKLLNQMAHAGIVSAVRGRGGGYFLPGEPVSLREVFACFQGPDMQDFLPEEFFDVMVYPVLSMPVRRFLEDIERVTF
jgi:DNA-binding IscR family transcriptional regulator